MLPTGHIAGGYLTGYALLKLAHPAVSASQQTQLLWWTTFFGFAPDLDVFFVFLKTRSLLVMGDDKVNHRYYWTHAPLLWLVAGLVVYFFGLSLFVKYIGLLIWLGSWSHFILDSIEHGVMWLWPFDHKVYAFKDRAVRKALKEKNFFKHSLQFLKFYTTKVSFYLEILIIALAIVVLIHK